MRPLPLALVAVATLATVALGAPRAAAADSSPCAGGVVGAPEPTTAAYAAWVLAHGCVAVEAAAAPDLNSPSPAISRIRSERQARERAADELGTAIGKLRLSPEETVANRLLAEVGVMPAILALLDRATIDVDYQSDGGVIVREAVATTDLVAALEPASPAAPAEGEISLVIDARGVPPFACLAPRIDVAGGGPLPAAVARTVSTLEGAPGGSVLLKAVSSGDCELSLGSADAARAVAAGGGPRYILLGAGTGSE
jgi:hypothetical protein